MTIFIRATLLSIFIIKCFLLTPAAHADTAIQVATVTATIASSAGLALGVNTVTFPSANPATTTSVPATENGLTCTVNARTGTSSTVLLTVLATGDLTGSGNTIPIANVSYTVTGTGFQAGTLSKLAAQTVGSWTGPGTHVGTINYFLANSFAYLNGTYTSAITYTLLAP